MVQDQKNCPMRNVFKSEMCFFYQAPRHGSQLQKTVLKRLEAERISY